jgi:predicted dehydrogenase
MNEARYNKTVILSGVFGNAAAAKHSKQIYKSFLTNSEALAVHSLSRLREKGAKCPAIYCHKTFDDLLSRSAIDLADFSF